MPPIMVNSSDPHAVVMLARRIGVHAQRAPEPRTRGQTVAAAMPRRLGQAW